MPGILSPSDLSVIGPLARSASDLEIATRAMAGPDEIQSRGMSLNLPELTKSLAELRVAVWRDDETAPVDQTVTAVVDKVADALKVAGAAVNFEARPNFESLHTHLVYQSLLQATMSCRLPQAQYDAAIERANGVDPNDHSMDATISRSQVARFREWVINNEARTHIRWAWHEFFKEFDIVLMPIMATTAFPHDHRPMYARTITVNGEDQNYFSQVFWAGVATNAYLPSTIIPTGPADDGFAYWNPGGGT